MQVRCMGVVIAVCLGMVLLAVPALAQIVPEGVYGLCFRLDEGGIPQPADTTTVNAVRQDNGQLYTDVTGDDWPTLGLHVARFADYTPPGTTVPSDKIYKMRARKVYGDMIWESPWTDSLNYIDGSHIERDLILEFSGAGQK